MVGVRNLRTSGCRNTPTYRTCTTGSGYTSGTGPASVQPLPLLDLGSMRIVRSRKLPFRIQSHNDGSGSGSADSVQLTLDPVPLGLDLLYQIYFRFRQTHADHGSVHTSGSAAENVSGAGMSSIHPAQRLRTYPGLDLLHQIDFRFRRMHANHGSVRTSGSASEDVSGAGMTSISCLKTTNPPWISFLPWVISLPSFLRGSKRPAYCREGLPLATSRIHATGSLSPRRRLEFARYVHPVLRHRRFRIMSCYTSGSTSENVSGSGMATVHPTSVSSTLMWIRLSVKRNYLPSLPSRGSKRLAYLGKDFLLQSIGYSNWHPLLRIEACVAVKACRSFGPLVCFTRCVAVMHCSQCGYILLHRGFLSPGVFLSLRKRK